ncbi:HAD family hydrolase [Mesobacillus harenae]|uniref:HAD family hydrolase n=1 Tax=Mesobacillus harenae TaxID=2213203 RepID=UPI00157FEE93|nr:HAD family hydrolase [Mesobacillus harenae]
MADYKILFLDIDGTIIRPDDRIEDSTMAAISEVKDKGIHVVLATGRPLHEIADIGKLLNVDTFVGYNGALAIHNHNEIFAKPMDPANVEYILKVAREQNHELVLYTSDRNYLTTYETEAMQKFIAQFHLSQNEKFTMDVIDKVLGITVLTNDPSEQTNYQFDEDINLAQVNIGGMNHCFDVIRQSVNKGVAVKVLLEHFKYERASSIAFGDGLNDKEMLAYVGEGFAMGNGHPDLFQHAKRKTTDVTNSGIYNGLKELGLID